MGQQSQQSSTSPNLTAGERGLINYGVNDLSGALTGGIPDWSQLYNNMPLLGTPDMSGPETRLLGDITGGTNKQGLTPTQQQAAATLSGFTGAPGTSPEFLAEQKVLKDTTLPATQQQSSLEGSGTSGASLEATANAITNANVPLLQNEATNALNATGQLTNLGATGRQQLEQALVAAGLPREIAQQRAQALYNQQEQKSSLATSLRGEPTSLIPASIGQTSVTNAPKI